MSESHDQADLTVCGHTSVLKLTSQPFRVGGLFSDQCLGYFVALLAACTWLRPVIPLRLTGVGTWPTGAATASLLGFQNKGIPGMTQQTNMWFDSTTETFFFLASHKFQTLVIHQGEPWRAGVHLQLHSRAEGNPKCMEASEGHDRD